MIPLPERLRPQTLEDWLGLESMGASLQNLFEAIRNDSVFSFILYAPPGTGKTSLALLIKKHTKSRFFQINAVSSGVKDLRDIFEQARAWKQRADQDSVLFVDEIHRFSKSQQDALLSAVEKGEVTLIGATTENPSFELNAALLSRVKIIYWDRLGSESLLEILQKGFELLKAENTSTEIKLDEDFLKILSESTDGDARQALQTLERLFPTLTRTRLADELKKAFLKHDKDAELHHQIVSAFIKSMRANETEAALYYLARLWEAGEDPLYIVRRMMIFASEDVGNADLRALAAMNAIRSSVEFVGRPECYYALAQGTILLSEAKKSREVGDRFQKALEKVRRGGSLRPPAFLTNAVTNFDRKSGKGRPREEGESYLPA
ncbi:MAG: AAA family ATPase [Deltaproteobacteria bacterium CG11_big_fil_rev_8_21_14_0_20_45_16]|nr:MAG: AAA family ATPase [Deltaproteobacteria bacterium CG11_big_fil_rev_8_21_14_0_20_45_16]